MEGQDKQEVRAPSSLAKAYVAAWAEIGAGVMKDANNPHFGNDYATLEAVETLVKPVLARHGLAFLQTPGAIDGDKIEIVGLLIHSSGESITCKMQMPLGGKVTAQSAGSAITYARRYQLMAVFGLAPVDDDGEAASTPAPAPKKPAKAPKAEGYAAQRDAVIKAIENFKGTYDEMEEQLRPQVADLGDEEVNKAYVDKRRQVKAARGK